MNIRIMIKSHLNLTKTYETRYLHPDTGEVLEKSHFLDNGRDRTGRAYFLYNGEWIIKGDVPEYREHLKNKFSSLEGFYSIIKRTIVRRGKDLTEKGRSLIGKNEFNDPHGCYDKIRAHLKRQTDEYGPYCPITGIELTFKRNNEKIQKGITYKITTNISPDRMLNNIDYTTRNVLFTTNGWNMARGNLSLKDMNTYMHAPFFKNYIRILLERFPDKRYEVDQLTELENEAEHPQGRR